MLEWVISSSILIVIVVLLRLIFKGRINLRLQYAMWGLVLLRLLIPFSIGHSVISVSNLAPIVQNESYFQNITDDLHVAPSAQGPNSVKVTDPVDEFVQSGDAITDNEQGEKLPYISEEDRSEEGSNSLWDILPSVLFGVWISGAITIGSLFLISNLKFRSKLVSSRKLLRVYDSKLDVYLSDRLESPCLFGIFHPAIYLSNEVYNDAKLTQHSIMHELTHYRHADHIWSILRCVCLSIHWYNPLVWYAAFLSRKDSELACDEATINALGENERAEYGKTLIKMTCKNRSNILITATTMSVGFEGIRERISLIVHKPKMAIYTMVVLVIIGIVVVGCTFTGRSNEVNAQNTTPSNMDTTESSESTTETTAEPTVESYPVEDYIGMLDASVIYDTFDEAKFCIIVQPTGAVFSGDENKYLIPGNQELFITEFENALALLDEKGSLTNNDVMSGWRILYQGKRWFVLNDGAIVGLEGQGRIPAYAGAKLYALCAAAATEADLKTVVRPNDISKIKSATLEWNGTHTVTEPWALRLIETRFANATLLPGGAACPFTALLTLDLENGETYTIAMATDDCAAWLSEGVFYRYSVLTEDGYTDNIEFYSLFSAELIHSTSKNRSEEFGTYLRYLNWHQYVSKYGPDETFALMDAIKNWVVHDTGYAGILAALEFTHDRGLDGAYTDRYASILSDLYEVNKKEFSWACLGNAMDDVESEVIALLAYDWNMSAEEVRTILQSNISE